MTVGPLEIMHTEDEAIYASKHSNQTSKVNEIINEINNHTDFNFANQGMSYGNIYNNENEYIIPDGMYNDDVEDKILVPNLNGKYLTKIILVQDIDFSEVWLYNVKLYNGEDITDDNIVKLSVLPGTISEHREDIIEDKKVYIFRVGILKLPDSQMLFRFRSLYGPGDYIKIEKISFFGYS